MAAETKRNVLWPLAATLVLLALPSAASAATYSGSVDDPADGRVAATDVLHSETRFDNSKGTWSTSYRFRGNVSATTNVQIYNALQKLQLNQFGQPEFVLVEIAIRAGKATLVPRYGRPQSASLTRSGKVLTMAIRDRQLVGLVPGGVPQTRFSYRTVEQDWLSAYPLTAVA